MTEQPIPANSVQTIRITIEWQPANGQINFGWPQVDDVIKLGMLEMAKSVLTEVRTKANAASASPLIVPARLVQ